MSDHEWEQQVRQLEKGLAWVSGFGLVFVFLGLLFGWFE